VEVAREKVGMVVLGVVQVVLAEMLIVPAVTMKTLRLGLMLIFLDPLWLVAGQVQIIHAQMEKTLQIINP
jgi:hypothetical protein